MNPRNPRAYLLLAHTLDRQQKAQPCIDTLNLFIERFPNLPDGYLLLVQIYQGTGRLAAAQEIAAVAVRRFPDHPKVQQMRQALGLR